MLTYTRKLVVLYFLFHYRRALNGYKIVGGTEVGLPLAASSYETGRTSLPTRDARPSDVAQPDAARQVPSGSAATHSPW